MRRPGQGEALVAWAVWGAIAFAVLVTYSRIDPADTYNVSRHGLVGGLSRSLTLVNFPIALVAIALALIAVAVLPRAAWWVAGPAIALCATIPWFVDQGDLDARWGNGIPALGVLLAGGLTAAATSRAGGSFAPHLRGDPARMIAAVLLLSRVRVPRGRLRIAVGAYLGAMLAYGAVNCIQDFWTEQVVKRGWTDASIPSAILPGAQPIRLVVVTLAVVATVALLRESVSASYSAA